MTLSEYAPFDGDGRYKRTPLYALPNTLPIAVTNSSARLAIDRFQRSGRSNHSPAGSTLWVILTWCQTHRVPYQLIAYPGLGYEVMKRENLA